MIYILTKNEPCWIIIIITLQTQWFVNSTSTFNIKLLWKQPIEHADILSS
jgi:hypothetical protein